MSDLELFIVGLLLCGIGTLFILGRHSITTLFLALGKKLAHVHPTARRKRFHRIYYTICGTAFLFGGIVMILAALDVLETAYF